MANRLAHSASTYLRQHAENPVDWFEWGDEAWTKARAEQKPVFLSVGYASCHWCHVMAHECFEDQGVAEVLNRDFVCIKVDREERPDVDDIYMTAVQLATGRGGWPMSVFLTPDQKPFFAGTYFPKNSRGESPGFLQILSALRGAWDEENDEILRKADDFTNGLKQVLERTIPPVNARIDVGLVDTAVRSLGEDFDNVNGGFGDAPKFPPFTSLRFLIRYIELRDALPGQGYVVEAVQMLFRTLEAMALGGIRDHVGGGFHRYAVDERWFLPHFEKMLSDNGQMLWLYARASRMVDDEELKGLFEEVVDGIVAWLEREMRVGDVYASAVDADTDGEEGLTYTWLANEVSQELGAEYGFANEGNFANEATGRLTGRNHFARTTVGRRPSEMDGLLSVRMNREQPERSEMALSAWNALAISGLVEAGRLDLARRIAEAWKGSQLAHAYELEREAFLDGYSYFADALLDLGEDASPLLDRMVELFSDGRGFTFSGSSHETLIGLQKPFLDQATPSGNGVAIRALRRAGRNEEALQHLTAAYGWAQRAPRASGTILEECLEQLVMGRQVLVSSSAGQVIRAEFNPSPVEIDSDGWAYTNLTLWIPNELHINSNDPGADWLVPTSVEVDGAYGEAGFPESETGQYRGRVEIALRLKPKGDGRAFSAKVQYQICSETECYQPTSLIVSGSLVGG